MGSHALFARDREVRVPGQGRIEVEGSVVEILPNGLFRIVTDDGDAIVAHVSSQLRMNLVRLLPGDRVRVAVSPLDLSRGRIVRRVSGGR